MHESNNKTLLGFSVGLGIGALLAALFTPKSGNELRDTIREKKAQAGEKVGEAKEWTKEKVNRRKDDIDKQIEELKKMRDQENG